MPAFQQPAIVARHGWPDDTASGAAPAPRRVRSGGVAGIFAYDTSRATILDWDLSVHAIDPLAGTSLGKGEDGEIREFHLIVFF